MAYPKTPDIKVGTAEGVSSMFDLGFFFKISPIKYAMYLNETHCWDVSSERAVRIIPKNSIVFRVLGQGFSDGVSRKGAADPF